MCPISVGPGHILDRGPGRGGGAPRARVKRGVQASAASQASKAVHRGTKSADRGVAQRLGTRLWHGSMVHRRGRGIWLCGGCRAVVQGGGATRCNALRSLCLRCAELTYDFCGTERLDDPGWTELGLDLLHRFEDDSEEVSWMVCIVHLGSGAVAEAEKRGLFALLFDCQAARVIVFALDLQRLAFRPHNSPSPAGSRRSGAFSQTPTRKL